MRGSGWFSWVEGLLAEKVARGGPPGSAILPPPISVPAGTTLNLQRALITNRWFDTTGAQSTCELPATPQNGDIVVIKLVGATVTSALLIAARGGFSAENPISGGSFSGTVSYNVPGGTLWFQADTVNTRWGVIAAGLPLHNF